MDVEEKRRFLKMAEDKATFEAAIKQRRAAEFAELQVRAPFLAHKHYQGPQERGWMEAQGGGTQVYTRVAEHHCQVQILQTCQLGPVKTLCSRSRSPHGGTQTMAPGGVGCSMAIAASVGHLQRSKFSRLRVLLPDRCLIRRSASGASLRSARRARTTAPCAGARSTCGAAAQSSRSAARR